MTCNVCPRKCGIDRDTSKGFCGVSNTVKIARASRHMWEEPCISGTNGSGTVFFSGCNLKCVFCQNEKISRGRTGVNISLEQLENLFRIINSSDVHNINLVTPTHYLPQIATTLRNLKNELTVPIVYNCSGYENVELIDKYSDVIDVFLTDFKYLSPTLSEKYSSCPDYSEVALNSLEVMLKHKSTPIIENGIMRSGVIVRHLVLPTHKSDSIDILNTLYNRFGNKSFLLSLMSQYTPNAICKNYPEINRTLTSLEYKRVTEVFEKLGFKGYVQGKTSATDSYVPDFDELGEFLSAAIK